MTQKILEQGYTQNRELSWLQFNARVLAEAEDENVPLLERFKFLAIFTSNLDEFFMIRVGTLTDASLLEPDAIDNKSVLSPAEQLEAIFADTRALIETGDAFTTLAFVELAENGERSFSFARKPGADTTLTETEVDFELIGDSRIFHVGSLSLTDEPARQATMSALKYASRHGVIVSYDPNYRAPLWNSREEAVHEMRSVLPYADVIKISEEEISLLTEKKTAEEAAEELQSGGIPCVIVTLGSKGALVAVKTGQIDAEAFPAKTVDTTGAGDAFMGGFLYMLAKSGKKPGDLSSDDAKAFTRFANAAASLCVEKRGAINAMPALLEVQGRLGKSYS